MSPRPVIAVAVLLAGLGSASSAMAQMTPTMLGDIKAVCTQPATVGEHWSISGGGSGIVDVAQRGGMVKGHYKLAREQWRGVQGVLAAQAAPDRADYRHCVETITAIINRSSPAAPRNQTEIARKLGGFLEGLNLAVPGRAWTNDALAARYSVANLPIRTNVSTKVLSGDFMALTNPINGPLGLYERQFLLRDGQLLGVMITSTCPKNVANVCQDLYDRMRAGLVNAEGSLSSTQLKIGGGPAGSPFAKSGVITDAVAYDDRWRVLLTRVDMQGDTGPTMVQLIVASN